MKHSEEFTYGTLDVHLKSAPMIYLGTNWRHSGNGKTYRVIFVTWLGATDEWGVTMQEEGRFDAVAVTRPEHHMLGNRDNGQPRYEQVF